MANENLFIPAGPQNITIRPLDKGIVNNTPKSAIPAGGFLDLVDFRVSPKGLTRRGDWYLDGSFSNFATYPPLRDLWVYWDTSGVKKVMAVDNKFLYEMSYAATSGYAASTQVQVYSSTADSSSIVVDGTAVTGTGTDFSVLAEGDVLYIGGASTGNIISAVADSTHLTLQASAATSGATSFDAYYAMYTMDTFTYDSRLLGGGSYPDYTTIDNNLVFVDSKRPPQKFNGTSTTDLSTSLTYVPTCIATYRDRLYIGQIQNDSSEFIRQRIRWSNVAPNYDTFTSTDYVDLPYTQGAIWRLVPYSNVLVAFCDDTVYLGRPTNSADSPVYFEQMETGGIGLVGMRALTGYLDMLFFVGQNNVYQLTYEGIKEIGSKAISSELEGRPQEQLRFTVMYTDSLHEKIGVVLSKSNEYLDQLWEMDMKTGAWSKLTIPSNFGFVKETAMSFPVTIADLGTTQMGSVEGRFGDYTTDIGEKRLYFGGGSTGDFGFLATLDGSTGVDYTGGAVQGSFVLGDLDLDMPNRRKLWNRFSLKISDQLLSTDDDLLFNVQGSVDRGQTWKNLGNITIEAGNDEGKVNFRMSGAQARFKVKQISINKPYIISEIVLRAKPRGREDRYE